ncbi:hypothetical protein M9H77_09824 [Catharanthus roseus]|uniref:Uncharacterized protein n=1 Tax=Catharanthus roseus TaxID=4058 RepID=A0ACC0C1P7_CATRO|nr:hypothetical protein M9H77_09824 [Catharanthus roseus]
MTPFPRKDTFVLPHWRPLPTKEKSAQPQLLVSGERGKRRRNSVNLQLLDLEQLEHKVKKMATLSELYTMQEAAQHNTKEDCWIVIEGKVYDVSSYLDEHPGGDDVLFTAAGKDATEEFEDAGHSKSARELMEKFCVGELDTSTTPAIPELEIVRKGQSGNLPGKILNLTKQYWAVSVAVVGIAVVVSVFCLRRK